MIESTNYMTAAYVVATTIYIIYSITLWSRARRYRRELSQTQSE
jgi:hypothetical protein